MITNSRLRSVKFNKLLFTVLIIFYVVNSIVPFVMISIKQTFFAIAVLLLWIMIVVKDRDTLFYYLLFLLPMIYYIFLKICENYLSGRAGTPIYIYAQVLVLTPMLLMYFLLSTNNRSLIKAIIIIMLLAYIVTAFTTLIGLLSYPMASRILASLESESFGFEYMSKLNIGGFEMIYSLVIVFPMIICLYKRKILPKLVFVVIAVIFFLCIYQSQYATALMLFSSSILLIFVKKRFSLKHMVILVVLSLLLVFVFKPTVANFLSYISSSTESITLSERFGFISDTLNGVENTTDAGNRVPIYMTQFDYFIKFPLTGAWLFNPNRFAGHSLIFDTLGEFGIIGMFVLFLFFKQIFVKFYLPFKNEEYFGYLVWCFLLYIGLSLINPTGMFIVLGFIIPGIAYLMQNGNYKIDKKGVPYFEDIVDM